MIFCTLPASLVNELDTITAQVVQEHAGEIAEALGEKPVTRHRRRKKTPQPAGPADALAQAKPARKLGRRS